jgi:hypothetical protein
MRRLSEGCAALFAGVAVSMFNATTNGGSRRPILFGSFSDFAENQIVQFFYRTGTPTKPAAMYHALYTAAPGETGGGTEVTGGSYARINNAPLDANWDATVSGDGHTQNTGAITFAAPTANWGVVSHTAQLDASSAGNFITWTALDIAKTVNNGDPAPVFAAGALDITVA